MSLMVEEPGPTTSEKRQTLLNKEQINNDESCTSKVTINGEFMIFKRTDCVKPLEQQLTDVLTDAIENETGETEMMNTWNEENGDQTVMKTMDFSAYDSSKKRECDDRNVNVMIKQLCAKSDVVSWFVLRLSGMSDQIHVAFCFMLVSLLLKCDQTLNDVREFETKAMNLEMRFHGAVNAPGENESESNSGVEANNCDESDSENEANATNDSNPVGTANTSPEVIDEARHVSLRLTLEESTNTETDRTTLQDTLEGMYDLDGININEDTLEELKTSHLKTKDTVNDQVITDKTNCHTDVAKSPDSVDSKGLNYHGCKTRVHINKQSPDITKDVADDVHVTSTISLLCRRDRSP